MSLPLGLGKISLITISAGKFDSLALEAAE